jgi:hypothetical protein
MTPADKLQAAILKNQDSAPAFAQRIEPINARIRGWSNVSHYLFFKSWLDAFPEAKSVLIVGVYLGRDISYMLDAAGERALNVTGVDKFNALPCDDWPAEKRHMTWEEAFNCPPPDMEQARKNIAVVQKSQHTVTLIKADDKDWLESATGAFCLCFYDASHEKASVSRQLRQGHKLCHPETIVSGDDFSEVQPGWGVETAVREAFRSFYHIDYRVWFTDAKEYL